MSDIRVRDEQGNTHVFPDGSTPEMIAKAMHVKPPESKPEFEMSNAESGGRDVSPNRSVGERALWAVSHPQRFLEQAQSDINEGGSRTVVGRLLGRMQGHKDNPSPDAPYSYSGGARGGEIPTGMLAGPFEAQEGGMKLLDPSSSLRDRVRGFNKTVAGTAKMAGPALAIAAPEALPAMVPSMAIGGATQGMTNKTASALGADPDTAEAMGNVATIALPAAMRGGGRIFQRNAPRISRAITQTVPLVTAAEELYNGRPLSAANTAAWGSYFAPRLARRMTPLVDAIGRGSENVGEVMAPWRHVGAPGAPSPSTTGENANPVISTGKLQPFPSEGEYVDAPTKELPPSIAMPSQGPIDAPGGFEGPTAPPGLPSARGRKLSTVTPFTKRIMATPEGEPRLGIGPGAMLNPDAELDVRPGPSSGPPIKLIDRMAQRTDTNPIALDAERQAFDKLVEEQIGNKFPNEPVAPVRDITKEQALRPSQGEPELEAFHMTHRRNLASIIKNGLRTLSDVMPADYPPRGAVGGPEYSYVGDPDAVNSYAQHTHIPDATVIRVRGPASMFESAESTTLEPVGNEYAIKGGVPPYMVSEVPAPERFNRFPEVYRSERARYGQTPVLPPNVGQPQGESELEMLRRGASERPTESVPNMVPPEQRASTLMARMNDAGSGEVPSMPRGADEVNENRSLLDKMRNDLDAHGHQADLRKNVSREWSKIPPIPDIDEGEGGDFSEQDIADNGTYRDRTLDPASPILRSQRALHYNIAHRYADWLENGVSIPGSPFGNPPLIAIGEDGIPVIIDGHHRITGARAAGVPIEAEEYRDFGGAHLSDKITQDEMRQHLDTHGESAAASANKLMFQGNKAGYDPVLPTGEGGYQVGPDEFVDTQGKVAKPQTLADYLAQVRRRSIPQQ